MSERRGLEVSRPKVGPAAALTEKQGYFVAKQSSCKPEGGKWILAARSWAPGPLGFRSLKTAPTRWPARIATPPTKPSAIQNPIAGPCRHVGLEKRGGVYSLSFVSAGKLLRAEPGG